MPAWLARKRLLASKKRLLALSRSAMEDWAADCFLADMAALFLASLRAWIGHGVGRDVHEDPEVPNFGKPGKGFILKPGMTIAIEPMITLTKKGEKTDVLENDWTVVTRDRCLSAHFEHTVAITTSGCEVLTLPADYP